MSSWNQAVGTLKAAVFHVQSNAKTPLHLSCVKYISDTQFVTRGHMKNIIFIRSWKLVTALKSLSCV